MGLPVVISPYIPAAIVADYLIWGRYPLGLKNPPVLRPTDMTPLTSSAGTGTIAVP